MQAVMEAENTTPETEGPIYVTMWVDKQMFGIDVKNVRDVLRQQKVTAIPLAPMEIAGSLNLRGRIVTVIDLRQRLGLPKQPSQTTSTFVVVEYKSELYSLMVDSVGEVLTLSSQKIEKTPANLQAGWKEISTGIYKLEHELLVLADVPTLLRL